MTDLSGTPAEQWRLLELGEVIRAGDEYWSSAMQKWTPSADVGLDITEDDDLMPYRRRIDPTLDPAEPLRRELREANGIIKGLIDIYERRTGGYVPRTHEAPALAWLDRNAAFGGKEGGQ